MALSACYSTSTMAPAGTGPVCPEPTSAALPSGPGSDTVVSWVVPLDDRDRKPLTAWCGAVAPPVVVLEPTGPAATWAPGEGLTVVAWNVAVGSADVLAFLDERLGHSCQAGPGTEPAAPFALLAQEAVRRSAHVPATFDPNAIPLVIEPADRPGEILDIVEVARRCGLALVYVPSARNGDRNVDGLGEDKGNAVLSNLPLRDPLAVEVPYEAGRKVAVGATLDAPAEPLRLVSIHLDVASSLIRTLITGNGTRLRQSEGMAEGLDRADPDVATVVGGDFNTWSETETALQRFAHRYPDSPPVDDTPSRGHFSTDHAFFRAGPAGSLSVVPGSYARIEPLYHSDHQAVVLTLLARGEGEGGLQPDDR